MEMHDFINHIKDKHLTIGDVKKMNVNDEFEVVIWDGNYQEYWIWGNAVNGKHYEPEEFFTKNKWKVIDKGNMEWDLHDSEGEIFRHPVHLESVDIHKWLEINKGLTYLESADSTGPLSKDCKGDNLVGVYKPCFNKL